LVVIRALYKREMAIQDGPVSQKLHSMYGSGYVG